MGAQAAKLETLRVTAPILKPSYLEVEQTEGHIIFADYPGNNGQRLLLDIPSLGNNGTPLTAQLKWNGAVLSPGQSIVFSGKLYAPSSPVEPTSYPFARRLFFLSIGATGVMEDITEYRTYPKEGFLANLSLRWIKFRWTIAKSIGQAFSSKNQTLSAQEGLAVALVTGMRGGISKEVWEQVRASGLAHLLAISGLHMGLVCGFIFWMIRSVCALSPSLTLRLNVRRWAAIGAFLMGLGYLFLSGASISSLRACIMIGIMLFAIMLNRRALTMRNVSLAALVILAIWPHSLLEAGFCMSFTITAVLVAVFEKQERLSFLRTLLLSSVVAFFVSSFLSFWIFNKASLYAMLMNIFTVPWFSFIVMPLLLLLVVFLPFGLHDFFVSIIQFSLGFILWATQEVSSWPYALLERSNTHDIVITLTLIGFFWLIIWQERWRYWGVFPMVIALFVSFIPLQRPHILIDSSARTVGVIEGQKRLIVGSSRYVAQQWQNHDGGRLQEFISRTRKRFTGYGDDAQERPIENACFVGICFLKSHQSPEKMSENLIVAYVWRLDTLIDACSYAHIVIVHLDIFLPQCKDAIVISSLDTQCVGSIALWWNDDKLRIITAKQQAGTRLWSMGWQQKNPYWTVPSSPFVAINAEYAQEDKKSVLPWKKHCTRVP